MCVWSWGEAQAETFIKESSVHRQCLKPQITWVHTGREYVHKEEKGAKNRALTFVRIYEKRMGKIIEKF